jgi:signal transduction histidine kinase
VQLTASEVAWTLDIANTGPGIPPEHQPRVFERFFRTDNSAATPGHGLGLSLSRELARAHGGDLLLVKSDGECTTFRFTLPHTRIDAPPAVASASGAEVHAASSWEL